LHRSTSITERRGHSFDERLFVSGVDDERPFVLQWAGATNPLFVIQNVTPPAETCDMAAIVRPNQTPAPAVARRPHAASSHRPRLTMVEGGRSPQRLAIVYRRRRIAALVLAVLLAGGLLIVGRAVAVTVAPAPPGSGAPVAAGPGPTTVVVVQPGDTLWAMARRLQPEGDVRPLVDRLAAAHGSGPLQAGEQLEVSAAPG
jgi:hypothetical protein